MSGTDWVTVDGQKVAREYFEGFMDDTAMETMVRSLAHRFGTGMPLLRFADRGKSWFQACVTKDGSLLPARSIICLERRNWRAAVSVMHEFAHLLDISVNGRLVRDTHSQSFYHNLRRVIEAVGYKDYPWYREGPRAVGWCRRDGVLRRWTPEGWAQTAGRRAAAAKGGFHENP